MHSFAALRWLYYSISRNTTAHTHIHTLRVAHCWTQLRVSGLARVAGAQPEKRIANFGMVTCGFGFGVGGRDSGGSPAPRSGRSAQAGTAYRSASSGLGEHWVAAIAHTLVEHTHLIPRHHAHDAAATAHPAQRWR